MGREVAPPSLRAADLQYYELLEQLRDSIAIGRTISDERSALPPEDVHAERYRALQRQNLDWRLQAVEAFCTKNTGYDPTRMHRTSYRPPEETTAPVLTLSPVSPKADLTYTALEQEVLLNWRAGNAVGTLAADIVRATVVMRHASKVIAYDPAYRQRARRSFFAAVRYQDLAIRTHTARHGTDHVLAAEAFAGNILDTLYRQPE